MNTKTKNTGNTNLNKLTRAGMVAALVVGALGLGGCASVSPENAKYGTTSGYQPAEVSSNYDAAYRDASPKNDAIAYALVHSGSVKPGFSVSESDQALFIEAMKKANDPRLAEMDKYAFVKTVMLTSASGGLFGDTLVPKEVASTLHTNDILEIKIPNSSRPAYFVRVATNESDSNPDCAWEGTLYYGIYTSGRGIVCKNGWSYKTDLPLLPNSSMYTHGPVPGPGSAIVKARKAETASK